MDATKAPKPIGKREMKKLTKERIFEAYRENGYEIQEMRAGSINYHTVKHPENTGSNQVVAAIYGSLTKAASLWLKESAFQAVKPHLPIDTLVEDVEPFRRGFQWAIHFEDKDDDVIQIAVSHSIQAACSRLEKTLERQQLEEQRAEARLERASKRAETRRDWRA